jgi:FkbM family methyltransferase
MSVEDGLGLLTVGDFAGSHNRTQLEAAIRRRCHTIPVEQHTILCRILGRYKFYVDCRDRGLAPHLMLDGYWEYWVSDFMWRNIKPGNTVIDVGANLGYYSVLMADLVGSTGRVVSFEPNPRLFELLQRNVGINGFTRRTQCYPRAVTARSDELLHFAVSMSDPKNGALMPALPDQQVRAGMVEMTVETMALDDLAVGPIDFIKIDVEGAEEALWDGIQQTIRNSPDVQILLEFNPLRCREPQRMLQEISALFPLRQLDFDALIRPADPQAILGSSEDTMLYLSRRDPFDYGTRE